MTLVEPPLRVRVRGLLELGCFNDGHIKRRSINHGPRSIYPGSSVNKSRSRNMYQQSFVLQ